MMAINYADGMQKAADNDGYNMLGTVANSSQATLRAHVAASIIPYDATSGPLVNLLPAPSVKGHRDV